MSVDMMWIGSVLILSLAALLPGAAALRWLRFSPASALERAVAVPVLGVTLSGTAVLVLLAARIYFWPLAALILVVPTVYLILQFRRSSSLASSTLTFAEEVAALRFADKVALLLAVGVVFAAFLDGVTSPPTWWDGYISWDKWAMDWGGRRHLYGYLCAYPQLFPMFASLVYKLTGTAGTVLPASSLAVHAINPLLAFVGLAAVVLIARRMSAPAWPLLLVLVGMKTWREALTTGTADVTVTTFVLVVVALGLGVTRTDLSVARGRTTLVAVLLFGALAAKPTGFLGTAVVASYLFITIGIRPLDGRPGLSAKRALVLLGLPVLLNIPFYAEQLYTERTLTAEQQNPREFNLPFARLSSVYEKARDEKGGPSSTPRQAVSTFLNEYSIPGRLHPYLTWCGACLLLAGLLQRRVWPVALPVVLYIGVWSRLFSYDQRNLLPAVPFLGLWLVGGGLHLWTLCRGWPRLRITFAGLLTAVVLPWPVVGGSVNYVAAEWKTFDDGRALRDRLRALQRGTKEEIATFFPDQLAEYLLLKNSGLAEAARQVIAGCHLYRWFPNGRYPWARFSWGTLQAGDIFIGNTSAQLPEQKSWLLIRDAPLRVYVFDPALRPIPPATLLLTGVHPPAMRESKEGSMTVTFSGAMSLVAYNVLQDRPEPGSRIIWQASCQATEETAAVTPLQLVFNSSVIDEAGSTVAVDRSQAGVVRYAGMLTLARRPLSIDPRDGVLVGLRSEVAGSRCELRDFRVSVSPSSIP